MEHFNRIKNQEGRPNQKGLKSRNLEQLIKEAAKNNLDLVAIQESQLPDRGVLTSGEWYRYVFINVHCPTEDKEEEAKDLCYVTLEQVIDQFESYDTRIVLGDFNAKIGREEMFRPTIGKESLHNASNDNGIRVINFATAKDLIIKTIRHTNVLNVRAYRGAYSDSDHFLVVAKLRARLVANQNSKRTSKVESFDIEKLRRHNRANQVPDRN
ncbi:hypothetical protein TSAR_001437 [Trichomalopsis sarcophagae]|uniref:Endonuclease/exonuclease/phosphatase domain-containing protein n=1 Tax=Trichomalopsis sarcophagae TaxID=543379 RepID=A0A232EXH9_9HYME|nr:hypothetical protein TSAR_001437 [Trichomalopsis sarcophagae]